MERRYFRLTRLLVYVSIMFNSSGYGEAQKNNASLKEPYPSRSASPETFGHTGYTGPCVWVDPKFNIVYIFLCNRVNPTRDNNKLGQLNIRPKIQETIYNAITQ